MSGHNHNHNNPNDQMNHHYEGYNNYRRGVSGGGPQQSSSSGAPFYPAMGQSHHLQQPPQQHLQSNRAHPHSYQSNSSWHYSQQETMPYMGQPSHPTPQPGKHPRYDQYQYDYDYPGTHNNIFHPSGYGRSHSPHLAMGGGVNYTPNTSSYFSPPPAQPVAIPSVPKKTPAVPKKTPAIAKTATPAASLPPQSMQPAPAPAPVPAPEPVSTQQKQSNEAPQPLPSKGTPKTPQMRKGPKAPRASKTGRSKVLPEPAQDQDDDNDLDPDNGKKPGKKRRKPIEQKRNKRRTSNNANASITLTIVSDDNPDRIVNPLLEVPEATSQSEPLQGAELYAPTDLVFHRPDTYPLSYMARLLGFDVPVPETPEDFPTPLGDIEKLPMANKDDDVFYQVPPAPTSTPNYRKVTDFGDAVDQHTLDYMDPVYAYILRNGFSSDILKAATSARVAKFAAQQKQQNETRDRTVQLAREIMCLSDDWTFLDWTSFVDAKEGRPRWTLDGTKVFSNPPPQAFGIIAMYKGKPVAILKYQFQWYQLRQQRESEIVMVVEGFGERTNMKESPTSNVAAATNSSTTVQTPEEQSKNEPSTDVIMSNTNEVANLTMTNAFPKDAESMIGNEDRGLEVPASSEKSSAEQEIQVNAEVTETAQDYSQVNKSKKASERSSYTDQKEMAIPQSNQHSTDVNGTTSMEDSAAQGRNKPDIFAKTSNDNEQITAEVPAVASDDATQGVVVDSQDTYKKLSESTKQENLESITERETDEPIPDVCPDDSVVLTMLALALEHTRACDVLYSLWDVPKRHVKLNRKCFRATELPLNAGQNEQPMVCDLTKSSSRLAFLMMIAKDNDGSKRDEKSIERLLVRFPTIDEAKASLQSNSIELQRSKRGNDRGSDHIFTGASVAAREALVSLRAITDAEGDVKCFKLDENGSETEELKLPAGFNIESQLDILRCFPVSTPAENSEPLLEDEILNALVKKQSELLTAERNLEPHLRLLMSEVVKERIEYEKPEAKAAKEKQKWVLQENEKLIEKRKEMDLAWQEQLEKDMNAVCNICNDGEVSPDNQILFCEACNVAVHQMCYGIEKVPVGDYYCIACRYFGRDKIQEDIASRLKRNSSEAVVSQEPLPICCELCPIKHGAYIRTERRKHRKPSDSKWVHMACAKWQGLQFLDKTKPEVVEDVVPLKIYFRKKDISCCLCEGKRGAYHNCRFEGCTKWIHVTCARAVGTCEVVHGEDVEGPVAENPWTLMCPDHSNIDPETLTREPVPREQLVEAAKEFPDDVVPKPPPQETKPFHKLNGKERAIAFEDLDYEKKIIDELIVKKFAGARCEVCDSVEDDGKNLARCSGCAGVVCVTCKLTEDENETDKRFFKCHVCKFVEEKKSEGQPIKRPECSLCFQKWGLLVQGFASPINKISYWKNNPKDFARSLFSRDLWAHYTCAFWLRGLQVNECKVDFSNAIMSNGKSFILATNRCALCGLRGGHKVKCRSKECRARGERTKGFHFHVTCARQAGLEVNHSDEFEGEFYAHCYVHGGNEFNLRAKIEDLIELEKRRSGKKMTRRDNPMNTNDASRLLNHAIVVVRILGWAWRWAEWWVEYDSNWEPLLEPNQKETDLTKKELKIVDSTQESRRDDARRCRLAAFGAALRNRNYDAYEGFDDESLEKAFRAVLHTPSLVGPLEKFEINFLVEWLGRAYRSKSKFLGLGDDKVQVAKDFFCVHMEDNSPKFELRNRPIPGKQKLDKGKIFETNISEPDDYLKPEVAENGEPINLPPMKIDKKPVNYKRDSEDLKTSNDEESEDEEEKEEEDDDNHDDDDDNEEEEEEEEEVNNTETPQPTKKRGRTSRMEETQMSSLDDKRSSVASLAPSAVKKRGMGPPRRYELESKPAGKICTPKKGPPVLEASIIFDDLKSPDGNLRKSRRGRPPKIWELPVVLRVGGALFSLESNTSSKKGKEEALENDVSDAADGDAIVERENYIVDEKEAGEAVASPQVSLLVNEPKSETDSGKYSGETPEDTEGAIVKNLDFSEKGGIKNSEFDDISNSDAKFIPEESKDEINNNDGSADDEHDKLKVPKEESFDASGSANSALEGIEAVSGIPAHALSETMEADERKSKKIRLKKKRKLDDSKIKSVEVSKNETEGNAERAPSLAGSPPKKKRGRPPKSPTSASTVSTPKDSPERTKRFKPKAKPVESLVGSFHAENTDSKKKRSVRKTSMKTKSLKEAESSSDGEDFRLEDREDDNEFVPHKIKRRRASRYGKKANETSPPAQESRVARSASKKARAGIEATLIEESCPFESGDSYHASSDNTGNDDSDESVNVDDEEDESLSVKVPAKKSRKASNKKVESDSDDDLPLSVLIESSKGGSQDGSNIGKKNTRKKNSREVKGSRRRLIKDLTDSESSSIDNSPARKKRKNLKRKNIHSDENEVGENVKEKPIAASKAPKNNDLDDEEPAVPDVSEGEKGNDDTIIDSPENQETTKEVDDESSSDDVIPARKKRKNLRRKTINSDENEVGENVKEDLIAASKAPKNNDLDDEEPAVPDVSEGEKGNDDTIIDSPENQETTKEVDDETSSDDDTQARKKRKNLRRKKVNSDENEVGENVKEKPIAASKAPKNNDLHDEEPAVPDVSEGEKGNDDTIIDSPENQETTKEVDDKSSSDDDTPARKKRKNLRRKKINSDENEVGENVKEKPIAASKAPKNNDLDDEEPAVPDVSEGEKGNDDTIIDSPENQETTKEVDDKSSSDDDTPARKKRKNLRRKKINSDENEVGENVKEDLIAASKAPKNNDLDDEEPAVPDVSEGDKGNDDTIIDSPENQESTKDFHDTEAERPSSSTKKDISLDNEMDPSLDKNSVANQEATDDSENVVLASLKDSPKGKTSQCTASNRVDVSRDTESPGISGDGFDTEEKEKVDAQALNSDESNAQLGEDEIQNDEESQSFQERSVGRVGRGSFKPIIYERDVDADDEIEKSKSDTTENTKLKRSSKDKKTERDDGSDSDKNQQLRTKEEQRGSSKKKKAKSKKGATTQNQSQTSSPQEKPALRRGPRRSSRGT